MGNVLVWAIWSSRRAPASARAIAVVSLRQPVLLGARADREPGLARRPLPAGLGGVRRGGSGARLRGRRDGDVPVRDRLPRRPSATRRGPGRVLASRSRAVVAAAALLVEIVVAIGLKAGDLSPTRPRSSAAFGSPAEIGRLFLTDHLLAFEITSIVLLVAAVGGVVLGDADARGGRRRRVQGPDVTWYLVVAALLFSIGTLGVLMRRSPLIILLSLEIMLNAREPRPDRVLAPPRRPTTARSSRSR